MEEGETPCDALIREVREELGVMPTKFELLAVLKEKRPEINGEALQHVYAVTDWEGGDPSNTSNEHAELKWFTVSEMLTLTNIADMDYPRLVQQALSGIPLQDS